MGGGGGELCALSPHRLRPRFSQRSFTALRKAEAPFRMTAWDLANTLALNEPDAVGVEADAAVAVKDADGLLEGFLAHAKGGADFVR